MKIARSLCLVSRSFSAVILFLVASTSVRAADYSWITTDGRFWTGNSATRLASYGTPTPPSSGPTASDNLTMTATGPLSLQNSSGTVEGGMNRALANLSSIVAGANMTSGVPAGNFTSLTVGSDINLSVASASLSFMNSSAAPVSTGAMTVTVNGNVNIGAGTSLYLGAIIESGTSSLSPLALNGFTANSTEAGKGQINVNGKLMLNRNTTNVTLGDVNVGAAGVVTLTGAGASDLAQTGTFNKSIQARSLTGSGVVQNSIVTSGTSGVTTSNATLVLNTLASTDATFSGVLQNGSGANAVLNLTVSGSGRQTLTGANTYTGSTAINAGTLIVGVSGSGSLGNTAVSVNNGGTLAGSGAIAGSVTVNAGGILSPGNSPGTQEYGSLGLNGGGNYNWQIYDAAGSAGATNGWDLIEVAGELNLNALTDSNRFNINLWSLSGIGPDVHGDALGFSSGQNGSWTIITAGSIAFNGSYDFNDLFAINLGATAGTEGFSNASPGLWTVAIGEDGQSVVLEYAAIPEPGTIALLAVGAAVWLFRKRRSPTA